MDKDFVITLYFKFTLTIVTIVINQDNFFQQIRGTSI